MKSTVELGTVETRVEYPKLMIHKESRRVILFYKKNEGTVVNQGAGMFRLGFSSDKWDESRYEDFKGSVTLEN